MAFGTLRVLDPETRLERRWAMRRARLLGNRRLPFRVFRRRWPYVGFPFEMPPFTVAWSDTVTVIDPASGATRAAAMQREIKRALFAPTNPPRTDAATFDVIGRAIDAHNAIVDEMVREARQEPPA